MEVTDLDLIGLKLIRPAVFRDPRGFFLESYHQNRYRAVGIDCAFVQDNHSRSVHGTLRGLHYQSAPGQAKLIRVVSGRIFDVAVDIRRDSTTLGRWLGVELDADAHEQLYVPVGFAHGFCVLSEEADVLYKVSSPYDAALERSIRYDDPDLGIAWPLAELIVSDRDKSAESFAEFLERATP